MHIPVVNGQSAAAAIKAPLIKANFNNLHSSRELYWLKLLNQNRDGNKGSQTEIERERERERERELASEQGSLIMFCEESS